MKHWMLYVLLLFAGLEKATAQGGVYLKGVDGRPFFEKSYVDIQGSPYLQDDWAKGTVEFKDGKAYKDVELKYDQVRDALLFKNEKGEPFEFSKPVKAFSLTNRKDNRQLVFRNGYNPVKGATADSYYELLADGAMQLLLRKSKKIREDKAYGSATTVRTVEEYVNYYISKNGTPVNIKKSEKAVLEAIGGNSAALEAYIRSNKLNLKNDEDLVKLIVYCNGLTPGTK
ncbi:hypothetical protein ACTJJ0_29130 [Chitinophaga sp. 22321]|uniref:DKNYY family protein n=1 Tax=Chitinophaga hostae TaxID=2831022 RepID=A0ABS5J760_9BACT|nr:hypothetical protein [Chitinophaga hostae]MBS0031058.1 hypothetical protein [Chitinophaga hostae]